MLGSMEEATGPPVMPPAGIVLAVMPVKPVPLPKKAEAVTEEFEGIVPLTSSVAAGACVLMPTLPVLKSP